MIEFASWRARLQDYDVKSSSLPSDSRFNRSYKAFGILDKLLLHFEIDVAYIY